MKKTGALEGAFAKTKKASDEPVKSNSVSSVKELKPKEGNSPEKKSLSVNSGSKKAKAGGIANFFAAKPKVIENGPLFFFFGENCTKLATISGIDEETLKIVENKQIVQNNYVLKWFFF